MTFALFHPIHVVAESKCTKAVTSTSTAASASSSTQPPRADPKARHTNTMPIALNTIVVVVVAVMLAVNLQQKSYIQMSIEEMLPMPHVDDDQSLNDALPPLPVLITKITKRT